MNAALSIFQRARLFGTVGAELLNAPFIFRRK